MTFASIVTLASVLTLALVLAVLIISAGIGQAGNYVIERAFVEK